MRCDVVVIGAGPAGLWAAKTAAEEGLDVIVLEEHPAVGLPKHCSGWLLGCEFTYKFFSEIKEALPYQKVSKMRVIDPLSGQIKEEIEDTGWGGYLVRRELFDRELARLALRAGAKLFLNVKVKELIKEEGQIVGVSTTSRRLPEVRARVSICADGLKSATSGGFARREIASDEETETYTGLQMELAGVEGANPGEIEIYESEDPMLSGRSLWPHTSVTLASFSSVDHFLQLKGRKDNLLSQKIFKASPIYIGGFPNRKKMGFFYRKVVKEGVLFVGEAAGSSGIVHGMITGFYAAKITKRAIEEDNLGILRDYEEVLRNSDIYRNPFCYRHIREVYGSYTKWLEVSKEIKL